MPETRPHIELTHDAIERGYRNCHTAVKSFYQGYLWTVSNIPGDTRRSLDTVLQHLIRVTELLQLDSNTGLSLEVWHEVRDDLSDAFLDKCTTAELAALIDTTRRYEIPKEFLFNSVTAADIWIRNRKFQTFEELETFASAIGGSTLAATIPILGYVKADYELAAIECGKAVFLTQILANTVNLLKQNQVFLAQQDLDECGIELHRLKLRQTGKPLTYLVRLYCARIEKIFYAAGKLIPHLDFDAKRSITSLLATHWRMLMQMEVDPDSILKEDGVLSRRDLLGLKSRHLLGLEFRLPIIPEEDGHDHH